MSKVVTDINFRRRSPHSNTFLLKGRTVLFSPVKTRLLILTDLKVDLLSTELSLPLSVFIEALPDNIHSEDELETVNRNTTGQPSLS